MEETGQRRRSKRISTLSETRKAQQATCVELDKFLENEDSEYLQLGEGAPSGSESDPGSKKRGKKKRKIMHVKDVLKKDDVKLKGIQVEEAKAAEQDNTKKPENQHVDHTVSVQPSEKSDAPEISDQRPAATKIPDKRLLKLVIDRLKRDDQRGYFALPVDTEQIQVYRDIILNPMDFFSLKEKLDQGAYESLENFESETFLIFSNAMLFNPADTKIYGKAQKLNENAKKIFHDLRTDPDNFDSKYSLKRKKTCRKPECETKGATDVQRSNASGSKTHTVPCSSNGTSNVRGLNVSGSTSRAVPRSSNITTDIQRSNASGSKNHTVPHSSNRTTNFRGSNASGTRKTCMPYESYQSKNESLVSDIATCQKSLNPTGQDFRYLESLSSISENLGPIAKMVAERESKQCQVHAPAPAPAQPQTVAVPMSEGPLDNSAVVSNTNGVGTHQSDRSKLPTYDIGDLNLPADGMTESSSFLSLRVNRNKAESDVNACKSTVASQASVLETGGPSSSSLPFQTNNSSESCLLPFPAKTVLIPNQAPSSSVPGWESQSQGKATQWQRYREGSAPQTSNIFTDLNLPSLQLGQSLHGENQVRPPSYASVSSAQAGLFMEGWRQTTQVRPSVQVYPSMMVPNSRYAATSSQAVPPPEKNLYNSLMSSEHFSAVQSEAAVRLCRQSNGGSTFSQTRLNPEQLGQNQVRFGQPRLWYAQTLRNDGIHLQSHINAAMNPWNQNRFLQPGLLRVGPTGSNASSLQLPGRNMMQNQQSQKDANSIDESVIKTKRSQSLQQKRPF